MIGDDDDARRQQRQQRDDVVYGTVARVLSLVMNMIPCDACKMTHKCNYYGLTSRNYHNYSTL